MYSDRAYVICLATLIMILYKKNGSYNRETQMRITKDEEKLQHATSFLVTRVY